MASPFAAAETIVRWWNHPAQMVREIFDAEPDEYQYDTLEAFPVSQRIAMRASKGVGKTCTLAWIIWNFLLTRPHPHIAATSITKDNLSDCLWPELAFWQRRSPLLEKAFEMTKTRIVSREYPDTWWCSARTWSKTADPNEQSRTLAGLHAPYILFVLDESGGIPNAVMASAEAALSTGTESHIVQSGNPTDLDGALYTACTTQRHLWHIVNINGDPDNPKRAKRVSIEWARDQIKTWGRDNPYVRVNVFGEFPQTAFNSLISLDELNEATRRRYVNRDIAGMAKIIACDVARQGDDSSVICKRQGLVMFPFDQMRGVDGPEGAGRVARTWDDWGADACFIDDTGGFGASWIDQLRLLGKSPIGVHFSETNGIDNRYANKRAHMYYEFANWIKAGGWIPDCPELIAAMSKTTYTHKGEKLFIEPKDDVKKKLGYSPDHADAAILTFAQPVKSAIFNRPWWSKPSFESAYDPFKEMRDKGIGKQDQRESYMGIGGRR